MGRCHSGLHSVALPSSQMVSFDMSMADSNAACISRGQVWKLRVVKGGPIMRYSGITTWSRMNDHASMWSPDNLRQNSHHVVHHIFRFLK